MKRMCWMVSKALILTEFDMFRFWYINVMALEVVNYLKWITYKHLHCLNTDTYIDVLLMMS